LTGFQAAFRFIVAQQRSRVPRPAPTRQTLSLELGKAPLHSRLLSRRFSRCHHDYFSARHVAAGHF
jgi:hypothetical protein